MSSDEEHGGEARPRRRKRGLLKLYYGSTAQEEDSKKKANPLDIDGEGFDGRAYLDKLLSSHELSTIMEKESKMTHEIQSLDSEMQQLVYENYNKFISATDTIRAMQGKMGHMEAQIQQLETNIKGISELSADINETLSGRRERIQKLSSGHAMLKKLQFLFELPARLRQCAEAKLYEQAVNYFAKASDVLQQYSSMESFRGIQEECEEIISAIKTTLLAQIGDSSLSRRKMTSVVSLLLQLKVPATELAQHVLDRARSQLESDISYQERQAGFVPDLNPKTEQVFETSTASSKKGDSHLTEEVRGDSSKESLSEPEGSAEAESSEQSPASAPPSSTAETKTTEESAREEEAMEPQPDALEDDSKEQESPVEADTNFSDGRLLAYAQIGNRKILANLIEWGLAYQSAIMPTETASKIDEDGTLIPPRPKTEEEVDSAKAVQSLLAEFLEEAVSSYLQRFSVRLCHEIDAGQRVSVLIQALVLVCSGVDGRLPDLIPGTKIVHDSGELMVKTVRLIIQREKNSIDAKFQELLARISVELEGAAARPLRHYVAVLGTGVREAMAGVMGSVRELNTCELAGHPFFKRGEFKEALVRQELVGAHILEMLREMHSFAPTLGDKDVPSAPSKRRLQEAPRGMLLVLVRFARDMGPLVLPKIDRTLNRVLGASEGTPLDEAHGKRCQSVASALLQHYVASVGRDLTKDIAHRWATYDWLEMKEPTAVREETLGLVGKLVELLVHMATFYTENEPGAADFMGSAREPSGSLGSAQSALVSNIRSLFLDRVEIFSEVAYNRYGIVSGILRIVLKALIENLRYLTLGKHGFQHIQVDAHFFVSTCAKYFTGQDAEDLVGSLVSQLLSSAANRSLDPEELDTTVIEMICDGAP